MLRNGLAHPGAELIVAHGRTGSADDREAWRKPAFHGKTIEGGQQFALGEIAVRPEDYDCGFGHAASEAQAVLKRIDYRSDPRLHVVSN